MKQVAEMAKKNKVWLVLAPDRNHMCSAPIYDTDGNEIADGDMHLLYIELRPDG